jgi:hypothetical protein
MTPLERRYAWLLRAYPAWYRRERAGEMLGTLLEASPSGERRPSVRDARSLVIGGLRVRGPLTWCLSILWAVLGALGAGYNFVLSAHVPDAVNPEALTPGWVGEPNVIALAAQRGALTWFLLTIPVLVAGIARLRRRWRRAGAPGGWWVVSIAWAAAWSAGIALMFQIADWQPSAPAIYACSGNQGCVLAGYRHAILSPGELAICAAWLAVGAAMALILARAPRLRARYVPAGTVPGT